MKNWFRGSLDEKIINIFNIETASASKYGTQEINELIGNIDNLFFTRSKELVSVYYGNGIVQQFDFDHESKAYRFMKIIGNFYKNKESILNLDLLKYK